MKHVKPINDQLAIADNQPDAAELQRAAEAGFQSVMNLRSHNESGVLDDEAQQAEVAGLAYVNIPVKPDAISDEQVEQLMQQIDELPKPALIHCKSGVRSGLIALMYAAIRQQMGVDQALDLAQQKGFDFSDHPKMQQIFEQQVAAHAA
ncbi:MAG: beta-lactamase hydrolase domain-containing protein [Thainema sp.]